MVNKQYEAPSSNQINIILFGTPKIIQKISLKLEMGCAALVAITVTTKWVPYQLVKSQELIWIVVPYLQVCDL